MLGALGLAACQHEVVEPTPEAGTLRVFYGFHWDGTADLDLDSTYADVSGHAIRFTAVRIESFGSTVTGSGVITS